MQHAPPDNDDVDRFEEAPPSDVGSRVSSHRPPRSQASRKSRSQVSRSQVSRRSRDPGIEPIEEIRSDFQEHEQSEMAKTIPIQSEAAGANVSSTSPCFAFCSFFLVVVAIRRAHALISHHAARIWTVSGAPRLSCEEEVRVLPDGSDLGEQRAHTRD